MQYDLVIVGATTAALGLAKSVRTNLRTLIVNKTEMVAYDVVHSYKLPEEYTRGAAYCKEFLELGIDILLGSEVVSIAAREGGRYAVELLGTGGFRTAETRLIVDTTTGGVQVSGKTLNALILHPGEEVPRLEWPGVELVAETHKEAYKTAILKMDCPLDWTFAEARHQLVDRWLQRPSPLESWRMAAIAYCFEERVTEAGRRMDEGYYTLPSAYYAGPEESMEAGERLGRSLVS